MSKEGQSRLHIFGLIIVILIAGNLRSPITAVSPVLSEIMAALNLTNVQGSLLTSIPLLVFASCSILVSKIGARANILNNLMLSVVLMLIGLYLRVLGNVTMLYVGSLLIGLGICIGNVMTPPYIKKVFPNRIGLVTGVFSVTMNVFAALAAGFSIAIGEWTLLGWQGSLGIWMVWSIPALLVVGIEMFSGRNRSVQEKTAKTGQAHFNVIRSKQAWNISVFMGIQSLVYFCVIAMLPTVLIEYGMDESKAGFVLLVFQLIMAPIVFICPIIAAKMKEQKLLVYFTGAFMLAGLLMLSIFKTEYIYLSVILVGISTGLAFSLSILFFSLRSRTASGTVKVSGHAQSVGYLIAAFGPPIFGMLHDWDSTWNMSFYFLMLMAVVMVLFGRGAAKARFIQDY